MAEKPDKQTGEHTGAWRPAFLAALSKFPNVSKAAKSAHVTRQAAYQARSQDPDFAQQWDDAWQEGVEYIEEVALRRATQSTKTRAASDTMLIFMLKGLKPETYRERFDGTMTLRGNLGVHKTDVSKLSDEDLEDLERILEKTIVDVGQQQQQAGLLAEPGGSKSGEGLSTSP